MKLVLLEAGTDLLPQTLDIFNAYLGFLFLEYELRLVRGMTGYMLLDPELIQKAECVVGNAAFMRKALLDRKARIPELDYPLPDVFYGREIRRSSLKAELKDFCDSGRQVFIKPVLHKLFPAKLMSDETDKHYFDSWLEDYGESACWASEPIQPLSEWRVFVYEQQLVGSRCYAGDFQLSPDYEQVHKMLQAFENPPIAYTLDVFITFERETFCMEINDFWAIGSYGLDSTLYAQMLLSRWQELLGLPVTSKSSWLT